MLKHEVRMKNHRETCESVLARLITEPDKYQPGKTKIFFRAGQVGPELCLENLEPFFLTIVVITAHETHDRTDDIHISVLRIEVKSGLQNFHGGRASVPRQ